MLQRILEPELMDTAEDAEEYDAMDFSEANTRFAEDALAMLGRRENPQVLDIGTGTARIPILMLQRRPDLRILAIDLAQEMLRVAGRNLAEAGFTAQCQLARLDAKAIKLPNGRFDLVMCNSTAHHIPDPQLLFNEIHRLARADGAIVVRDLHRPTSMDAAWAIVKRVAAGDARRQQQLFFDSLCAALRLSEVQEFVRKSGLQRMSVYEVSDRHWTAERRALKAPSIMPASTA